MTEDRYEIRKKIGQGGLGAVFRAWDHRLNREVAIKRVLPDGGFEDQEEAVESLLQEATSLSSLQHPHIVTIFDAGKDKEGPYVVMELLDGRTLDEMLEQGTLTEKDFHEVAIQTQEALIAAQELDLVHRDLKPTNVMVVWLPSGKFQIKLVDFGLARFTPKPSLQSLDEGDAVLGSVHFMAPEQFERGLLDRRADMYSMGCMYYFALTNTYPFDGETAAAVMASHLEHRVVPLQELRPDLPAWLVEWVMWHIERQVANRPESARDALQQFLLGDQQHADQARGTRANQPPRTKLVFPGQQGTPAPPTPPTGPTPPSPDAPAGVHTATAPQPLLPPEGQKPSIHTTSQVTASQPATPEPVPAPAVRPSPPVVLPRQGMGNAAKMALAAILAVALMITGLVVVQVSRNNAQVAALNALLAQVKDPEAKDLPTSKAEALRLLNGAVSLKRTPDRNAFYQRLLLAKSSDGTDLDELIGEYAGSESNPIVPDIRIKLFQVLRGRQGKSALPYLIQHAQGASKPDTAIAALHAAEGMATKREVPPLLKIIQFSDHPSVRQAAKKTVVAVAARGGTTQKSLARDLEQAYQNAVSDEAKLVLIELLGAAGGERSAEIVRSALANKDRKFRLAAYAALSFWPDDTEFATLVDTLAAEEDTTLRRSAFNFACTFLRNGRQRAAKDLEALWTSLAREALSRNEKIKVIRALGQLPDDWAFRIVKPYENDEDDTVSGLAKRALQNMEAVRGAP